MSHTPDEMLASKIAAVYGRRRHRSLFDLWAGIESEQATEQSIADFFGRCRPARWTALLAADNLKAKLADAEYANQLDREVAHSPRRCDLADAAMTAAGVIDGGCGGCSAAWGDAASCAADDLFGGVGCGGTASGAPARA